MAPLVVKKIEEFFKTYETVVYQKGQILIQAGDDPENVWYISSGKVKQYHLNDKGDEAIINVFKPPAFFPMSFAINRTPNEYFFEAESKVEIRKAPVEAVIAFVKTNPDVLFDLLSRVYIGADAILGRMVGLMSGNARSRVIYELIIECSRFGELHNGHYLIDLNESDIAARAGLSRETVSREIYKLKTNGYIQIDKKQIVVTNLPNLQALFDNE